MRFGRVAFETGTGKKKIERVVDGSDAFVINPCKE